LNDHVIRAVYIQDLRIWIGVFATLDS